MFAVAAPPPCAAPCDGSSMPTTNLSSTSAAGLGWEPPVFPCSQLRKLVFACWECSDSLREGRASCKSRPGRNTEPSKNDGCDRTTPGAQHYTKLAWWFLCFVLTVLAIHFQSKQKEEAGFFVSEPTAWDVTSVGARRWLIGSKTSTLLPKSQCYWQSLPVPFTPGSDP